VPHLLDDLLWNENSIARDFPNLGWQGCVDAAILAVDTEDHEVPELTYWSAGDHVHFCVMSHAFTRLCTYDGIGVVIVVNLMPLKRHEQDRHYRDLSCSAASSIRCFQMLVDSSLIVNQDLPSHPEPSLAYTRA
jgi:hypothetical protein